jgi:hypothetical protein
MKVWGLHEIRHLPRGRVSGARPGCWSRGYANGSGSGILELNGYDGRRGVQHNLKHRDEPVNSGKKAETGDYCATAAARRRRVEAGLFGAVVVARVSTTREDWKVRKPCSSNVILVWYSLTLSIVPSPYWL